MTRNEKKTAIENMAERFMNISDLEGKSMAIMVMSAYAEGKAAQAEEQAKQGLTNLRERDSAQRTYQFSRCTGTI